MKFVIPIVKVPVPMSSSTCPPTHALDEGACVSVIRRIVNVWVTRVRV